MLNNILAAYGLSSNAAVKPFGSGLINHTWFIDNGSKKFILQKINDQVFKNPKDIAINIRLICDYLKATSPEYLFTCPLRTAAGDEMYFSKEEGYYRLFAFIENSHTINVVDSVLQAHEAAKQFGRFTALLADFPVEKLKITLPEFHNLPLRFQQFEQATKDGNKERTKAATDSIKFLKVQFDIVAIGKKLIDSEDFKLRVTHHDCKISNVLFDDADHGLCVIDLDTVMPGYFISDFGDMMRTYLSPVSEEETDLSKIEIRDEYFKAIADGYLCEMKGQLSKMEKDHLVYAGKFMTYMQALRFLTDHLNNDIYYGAKYEGHNFVRANNQVTLLKKIIEKEKLLGEIAARI